MSNQHIQLLIENWINRLEKILPTGTLVKATCRTTSRDTYTASFRTQVNGKAIILSAVDSRFDVAIAIAGYAFYRKVLEHKNRKIQLRKQKPDLPQAA